MMHFSDNCVTMLKGFERCVLKAYRCPAGKWTLGYGMTVWPNGKPVVEGESLCNEANATKCLEQILEIYNWNVNRLLKVQLFQNQFDALILLSYNIGLANFGRSTLLREVNVGNFIAAEKEFHKWIYGGDGQHNGRDDDGDGKIDEPGEKQRISGLIIRRNKEAQLFMRSAA